MLDRYSLVTSIEEAFENVSLGNGIGILEADKIDNYSSEEEKKIAKNKDMRDDWRMLTDEMIDEYSSSLSFMDENGLRFALPAFMRFSLMHYSSSASPAVESIIHTLSSKRDWGFLSKRQKSAIALFLEFMVLDAEGFVDTFQASLAYEHTWSKFPK